MDTLVKLIWFMFGLSCVLGGVAISFILSELKRRKKFNALLGGSPTPLGYKWGHTIRAGCIDYVDQREANASVKRLAEAGQRLQEAIKEAREGRLVESEYLDLIQADWKAVATRHGVEIKEG